jgi:hypothetical protein
MYGDRKDLKMMLQKARAEHYPISDAHLAELEAMLAELEKNESELEEQWGKWWSGD